MKQALLVFGCSDSLDGDNLPYRFARTVDVTR